jgi:acyl dehydratase
MVDVGELEAGTSWTHERTFTSADVERFAELSGDEGHHHLVAQSDGAVLVHGLLTATLPTKLGGDLDFLARRMVFEFPRPVHTGQSINCELNLDRVEERDDRYDLAASFECTTSDDEVVLRGEIEGVVMKDRVDSGDRL